MSKKNTKLYAFICPYSTRNLMIRGMARRILSARHIAPTDVPSFSSLVNEIIEDRLGLSIEKEVLLPTKKTVLMFYMPAKLHEAFFAEAAAVGKSATKLLSEIIMQTDFYELKQPVLTDVEDEKKGCCFNLLSECRTKLYKEIARGMLRDPDSVGTGASVNCGKMLNDMLSVRYNISIKRAEAERFVPNEQFKMTMLIEDDVHLAFKSYCEKLTSEDNFISMNATINKWIVEAAANEMW